MINFPKMGKLNTNTSKSTMKKIILSRNEKRVLVKSQYAQGNKNPKDISKHTNVPLRTVYRYLSKLSVMGTIIDAKRTGRPKKNTTTLHRQLGQIKHRKPRLAAQEYTEEILQRTNKNISKWTVRRALHQLGYHWRLPGRKKLSHSQKVARMEFARTHQDDDWSETWSFDEAYFNLYRHSNRCWISTSTEESVQLPKLTTRQEKISIGICFAISKREKSALCFLPKNWTGTDLVKVFKETLLPSISWPKHPSKKKRFIIDNDGRHQMQVWKDYVAQSRIHPLTPWPSNSPDRNPIENIFAWMKHYVEGQLPTNEQTLRQAVTDAFRGIPQQHFQTLMDSMENRLKSVVKSKGARINY